MSVANRWAVGLFVAEDGEMMVSLTVGDSEMRTPPEVAKLIADALNTCAQYVEPDQVDPDA